MILGKCAFQLLSESTSESEIHVYGFHFYTNEETAGWSVERKDVALCLAQPQTSLSATRKPAVSKKLCQIRQHLILLRKILCTVCNTCLSEQSADRGFRAQ